MLGVKQFIFLIDIKIINNYWQMKLKNVCAYINVWISGFPTGIGYNTRVRDDVLLLSTSELKKRY